MVGDEMDAYQPSCYVLYGVDILEFIEGDISSKVDSIPSHS